MYTNDELPCPGLANIFEDFKVCFSPSASKDSLALMVEESINSFWGGRFIRTHDPSNLARQITIENWAEGTKKNSLFGISYGWRDSKLTVAKMIDKVSADFVAQPSEKKEKGNGNIMSALDKMIGSMATAIANEMKEVCFNLVPAWTINETAIEGVATRFNEVVVEFSDFTKAEFGKDIQDVLSEEALKQVFEVAVERALEARTADAEKPMKAAQKALHLNLRRIPVIPIHFKSSNAGEPPEGTHYIVARNGLFLHKKMSWVDAVVPVAELKTLDLELALSLNGLHALSQNRPSRSQAAEHHDLQ